MKTLPIIKNNVACTINIFAVVNYGFGRNKLVRLAQGAYHDGMETLPIIETHAACTINFYIVINW